MCDDSDQETSELDIESRTWKKLENEMKLLGFREGAAEGRHLSLQEGFNLGYSDGFKLGEKIGIFKGILRCESDMDLQCYKTSIVKNTLDGLLKEACALCLQEKKSSASCTWKIAADNIDYLVTTQQSHNNEVIKVLEQSDFKYLNKR